MQAEVHGLCRRLVRLEHSILRRKVVNNKLAPSPFFHKNIILKEVKVLCFDRLLQVLILTDLHTYIFEI